MKFTGRITILFGTFLALFGLLGLQLWFVQIAEGAEAAETTDSQSWVYVSTAAPRGNIRDVDGDILATARYVPAVEVDRHLVSSDEKDVLIQRLSTLLNIPAEQIAAQYEAAGVNGRFDVAIVDAVDAYRITEQLRDYPGVRIKKVPERIYLTGEVMAHVIGHLGLPTEADLEARPDLDPEIRIGKLGVEQVYDEYLQGEPGTVAYRVQQAAITEQQPEEPPEPGDTVYLTLDLDLNQVVEESLIDGIQLSNEWKEEQRQAGNEDAAKNETVRGAAVVLNARTGAVEALASYPSFDPELFVTGLDNDTYELLNESGAFLDLAVSGLYPPASTFKAVTYLTYLEEEVPLDGNVEGVDAANGLVSCDGTLELPGLSTGETQVYRDWYTGDFGFLDLSGALEKSCNIFFYNVALGIHRAWDGTAREQVLQEMARDLGFGSQTGIDLGGDAAGIIPDRDLFLQWQELQREDEDAPQLLEARRVEQSDPWVGGDLMNAAIGQGYVNATPMQVAVAYAAMVNGGRVLEPYVVDQIRDNDDEVVFRGTPSLVREVPLEPSNVARLRRDLNRVVTVGTASSAFDGFGESITDVGGKTGTGQSIAARDNHAWFAGVVGIEDPEHIVVILIDEGGSGGAIAAPVARRIMQYLAGEEMDPIVAGEAAQ